VKGNGVERGTEEEKAGGELKGRRKHFPQNKFLVTALVIVRSCSFLSF